MKLKEERGGQLAMVCKIVRSFIFEKLKLLSAFSLTFGDFVFLQEQRIFSASFRAM